jgi:hypothetical protein
VPTDWWSQNRRRFHGMCARYGAVLRNLARIDHEAYRQLLESRSRETDHHVARVLAESNLEPAVVLDDAWFATRWIWTNAVVQGGLDPSGEEWSFTSLMRRLPRDPASGQRFVAHKRRLLEHLGEHTGGGGARCSILGCPDPGDALTLNSLPYCGLHHGLALFNGLRHGSGAYDCDACIIFNAVALRYTLSDGGHLAHALRVLRLPLGDRGTDTFLANGHLRITGYANGEMPTQPLEFVAGPHNLTYRRPDGSRRRVPDDAFVHRTRGGRVIAWLKVWERSIDDGGWTPVTRTERLANLEDSVQTSRLLRGAWNAGLYTRVDPTSWDYP